MLHKFQPRELFTPIFHFDANLINSRNSLDSVNQMERWAENDVILINWSQIALTEASSGNDLGRIRKASQQIFTATRPPSPADQIYKEVEQLLFPAGAIENQMNDVMIVCEALHYNAYLVTNDGGSKRQPGGILGSRDRLKIYPQLRVFSPNEAVQFITEEIRKRDEFNRRISLETGAPPPQWTGTD